MKINGSNRQVQCLRQWKWRHEAPLRAAHMKTHETCGRTIVGFLEKQTQRERENSRRHHGHYREDDGKVNKSQSKTLAHTHTHSPEKKKSEKQTNVNKHNGKKK